MAFFRGDVTSYPIMRLLAAVPGNLRRKSDNACFSGEQVSEIRQVRRGQQYLYGSSEQLFRAGAEWVRWKDPQNANFA